MSFRRITYSLKGKQEGLWAVLIAICVVSGIFIFGNMKKIESATE